MNIFTEPTGNRATGANTTHRATYAIIQRRVAGLTGIAAEHLEWPQRGRTAHMNARHLILYLAATEAGLSASALADIAGRHRQAISHALQRIEHRRDLDAAFDRGVDLAASLVQHDLTHVDIAGTRSASRNTRSAV